MGQRLVYIDCHFAFYLEQSVAWSSSFAFDGSAVSLAVLFAQQSGSEFGF